MNQCDGCRRRLPTKKIKSGMLHIDGNNAWGSQFCTKERYGCSHIYSVTEYTTLSGTRIIYTCSECGHQEEYDEENQSHWDCS